MASLREALQSHLEADTALMAALPGGVFEADDIFRGDVTMRDLPRQAGSTRIQRFMVIRWRGSRPTEIPHRTEREEVEFYIYDHAGYAGIETVIRLLKTTLNRVSISADNQGPNMFHFSFKSGEVPDDTLGGLPCRFVRYYTDYAT